MLEKIIDLKADERLEVMVRSSLWHWFWSILAAIILILLPFFLIYPLFKNGWWGITIFAVILLAGILLALRLYLNHYFTVFILTSHKIVDVEQTGFFSHRVSGFLYDRLREVSYQSGPLQSLAKIGDVYLNFYGSQKVKLKLPSVKNPQTAVNQIIEQQEKFFRAQGSAGQEAEKILAKIRKKLGEEKFQELLAEISE